MSQPIQTCFRRYEKKYLLTRRQQAQLLAGIAPYVVPDRYGQYGICSIYYDTPDWRLTRASMEKPLYKEKLRVRSYGIPGEDGPVFVELKKKFDGVVYKRRITAEPCAVDPFLHALLPPDRVLMELKLPGACPLWLSSLLDRAGAFPTSFSKLGTCYKQFILPKEAVFCA